MISRVEDEIRMLLIIMKTIWIIFRFDLSAVLSEMNFVIDSKSAKISIIVFENKVLKFKRQENLNGKV